MYWRGNITKHKMSGPKWQNMWNQLLNFLKKIGIRKIEWNCQQNRKLNKIGLKDIHLMKWQSCLPDLILMRKIDIGRWSIISLDELYNYYFWILCNFFFLFQRKNTTAQLNNWTMFSKTNFRIRSIQYTLMFLYNFVINDSVFNFFVQNICFCKLFAYSVIIILIKTKLFLEFQ